MSIKTKIEWCDSTINPVMGCTGCSLRKNHCYAATLCTRYAGRKGWPKSFDRPEIFPGRLEKAIRWKDLTGSARPDEPWLDELPRMIFVNDLSDGFCPDVDPDEWLLPHLDSMGQAPHVWMLLTKWPERMRKFFQQHPPPNTFWLGVSAENQKAADERIPVLLPISAVVRFVSFEPLLEEIDIRPYGDLSWAIIGGETGPGARPMRLPWMRSLRDQCQEAQVPFFFKKWGAYRPSFEEKRQWIEAGWDPTAKGGGRILDGREWNEFPRKETK